MATITIVCPDMPITRQGLGHFITAIEVCVATVTLDDGTVMVCDNFTFPPCQVSGKFPHQQVEAVVATGTFPDGSVLSLDMPAEPVTWGVAVEVVATGTLTLANKKVGQVTATFPPSKTTWHGIGKFIAAAVTATGTITFNV